MIFYIIYYYVIILSMNDIKQLAIIGSTASGKTSLAISTAKKIDAYILSLDSLSIYKEIDIVSAKPTIQERDGIKHFGIDEIYPNEPFSVQTFIELYQKVYQKCQDDSKSLVIVGGTSFYLKMLLDGISPLPAISTQTTNDTLSILTNLKEAYSLLQKIDPLYAKHIKANDRYRIQKALEIYLQTNTIPSQYFQDNPPIPYIKGDIDIYEIVWQREEIRDRIKQRTKMMIEDGVIDEVAYLESKYTREPNCMKAIGIKECLDYLDGKLTKQELEDKISTNTARLAKRQKTFNNSQFSDIKKINYLNLKHRV